MSSYFFCSSFKTEVKSIGPAGSLTTQLLLNNILARHSRNPCSAYFLLQRLILFLKCCIATELVDSSAQRTTGFDSCDPVTLSLRPPLFRPDLVYGCLHLFGHSLPRTGHWDAGDEEWNTWALWREPGPGAAEAEGNTRPDGQTARPMERQHHSQSGALRNI